MKRFLFFYETGVALKQLTSFFTQLKENDEDDSSASDEA